MSESEGASEPAEAHVVAPASDDATKHSSAKVLLIIGAVVLLLGAVGVAVGVSSSSNKPKPVSLDADSSDTTPPTEAPTVTAAPTVTEAPTVTAAPASSASVQCTSHTPATVDFIHHTVTAPGDSPAEQAACQNTIFGQMKAQADQSIPAVVSCEANNSCMSSAAMANDYLNAQATAYMNATASMEDTWTNGY